LWKFQSQESFAESLNQKVQEEEIDPNVEINQGMRPSGFHLNAFGSIPVDILHNEFINAILVVE
jgi:hypothetical protein